MYNESQQTILLQLATDSILSGLENQQIPGLNLQQYDNDLTAQKACFVTLQKAGQLRGCIGHLVAQSPLIVDVSENAFAAAFRDPRFPPLQNSEFTDTSVSISVLSSSTEILFDTEKELIRQLTPGIDGLILQEGNKRGTFLPSVWEQLPDPASFLQQLKMKAGLDPLYWSDTVRVSRYTTEIITAR